MYKVHLFIFTSSKVMGEGRGGLLGHFVYIFENISTYIQLERITDINY